MPWMIEVALALSIATKHWADAAIIGALLVLAGAVSFWEEHQTGNAMRAMVGVGLPLVGRDVLSRPTTPAGWSPPR